MNNNDYTTAADLFELVTGRAPETVDWDGMYAAGGADYAGSPRCLELTWLPSCALVVRIYRCRGRGVTVPMYVSGHPTEGAEQREQALVMIQELLEDAK